MTYRLFIWFAFVLFPVLLHAGIFCPPHKNMLCSDDKHNLDILGRPVLVGNSLGKTARYIDDNQLNSCNVGYIYRKWYVDSNNDGSWQEIELYCIQNLYFGYENYPVSVSFPPNRTYSCKEDIRNDRPTWVTGPCNVMGFSFKDDVFEVADDACYKILRHFKVIDWCDADGDGIMNIWEHTQVIKVIDEDAPVIQQCQHTTFFVGQDCKAEVRLTSSAIDDQACGAQLLIWTAFVDLWGDGTYDLEFSNLKTGDFYLAPKANGAEVSVLIPERVGLGFHKVYWSVRDECGNTKSCHATFDVVDKKPPTPYLHTFLTAAFDATTMPLMVPARIFNVGSYDNCSPAEKLRYSFSEDVNDTIRIVDCTNAGFQFYSLYVTDKAGNQEVVDVFLLAFDNGSCSASTRLFATLKEGNDSTPAVSGIMAKRNNMEKPANSEGEGRFVFENMPLYADFAIEPTVANHSNPSSRINVMDLVLLQEYIFGKQPFSDYEWIAADIDADGSVRSKDLLQLRRMILKGEKAPSGKDYRIVFEPGEITLEKLASYTSHADIMEYDGQFDFRAVLLGDISEANGLDTENRKVHTLYTKQTEQSVELYAAEEMTGKGIQLECSLPAGKEVVFESDVLDLNVQHMFTDKKTGRVKILIAEDVLLQKNIPLLRISGEGAQDVVWNTENWWVSQQTILQKITIQSEAADQSLFVFPNPGAGNQFYLSQDVRVNKVYSIDGKMISFVQNGQKVQLADETSQQFYFVETVDEEGKSAVLRWVTIQE